VTVASHAAWRTVLGGRDEVLGSTIRLNGQAFTVIGVAPPGFHGTSVLDGPDFWIPLERLEGTAAGVAASFQGGRDRGRPWLSVVVARRAPGVGVAQAAARVELAGRQLDLLPEHGNGYRLQAEPLLLSARGSRGAFTQWIGLFGAVVLLVLVAACSNVAGLLAGRTLRRRRELGIRLALGESRGHLAASLLLEAVVLALAGAALALAILWLAGRLGGDAWAVRGVVLRPNAAVVATTLAIAGVSALLCGLLPALAAARPGPRSLLGDGAAPGRRFGAREVLVVLQVAICFLVLVGAALTGRTLRDLLATPLGFEPSRLIAASVDVAERGWGPEQVHAFFGEVRVRLERAPAVEHVGLAAALPMTGSEMAVELGIEIEGGPVEPPPADGDAPSGALHALGDAGLLEALGIPIIAGRGFGPQDTATSPLVALVNEAAARTLWAKGGAVGQRVRVLQTEEPVEIVGVMADARLHALDEAPRPLLLLCHVQAGRSFIGGLLQQSTTVVARASGSSEAAIASLRQVVRELLPEVPLYDVTTLEARLGRLVQAERQATMLFALSSGVALVLALLGLFAVAAQSVVERTRELGVRTACGATPRDLGALVLRRSALSALCGIALGVVAASPLGRLIEGQLRGASATAPVTWALVGALLLVSTCAVAWVPARRAARIDPVRALRRE
jgi:putative ABC transport system permease protein